MPSPNEYPSKTINFERVVDVSSSAKYGYIAESAPEILRYEVRSNQIR